MRISDWSSDVCSSDLVAPAGCAVSWHVERDALSRVAQRPNLFRPEATLEEQAVEKEHGWSLSDIVPAIDGAVDRRAPRRCTVGESVADQQRILEYLVTRDQSVPDRDADRLIAVADNAGGRKSVVKGQGEPGGEDIGGRR